MALHQLHMPMAAISAIAWNHTSYFR